MIGWTIYKLKNHNWKIEEKKPLKFSKPITCFCLLFSWLSWWEFELLGFEFDSLKVLTLNPQFPCPKKYVNLPLSNFCFLLFHLFWFYGYVVFVWKLMLSLLFSFESVDVSNFQFWKVVSCVNIEVCKYVYRCVHLV